MVQTKSFVLVQPCVQMWPNLGLAVGLWRGCLTSLRHLQKAEVSTCVQDGGLYVSQRLMKGLNYGVHLFYLFSKYCWGTSGFQALCFHVSRTEVGKLFLLRTRW